MGGTLSCLWTVTTPAYWKYHHPPRVWGILCVLAIEQLRQPGCTAPRFCFSPEVDMPVTADVSSYGVRSI